MRNGVVSTPFRVAAGSTTVRFPPSPAKQARALRGVALVQEAQAVEGEEVVDDVDLLAERHDVLGEAAGGDRLAVAHLGAHPPQDGVDLAGEAVDDAAADR